MKHLDKGVPILTAKNVLSGSLDLQKVHYADPAQFKALTSKSKPNKGDILITKDGTIGRCAVVNTDAEICINQSVALVQLHSEKVLSSYVLAYLNSDRLQQVMRNMSKGNALAHLQITELAKLPIPLPPVPKQMEFSERISRLEKVKSVQTKSDANLNALFASLQHRAFRGEL
jgi:type I restriction enzyme S subunit